ncbi:hypothetical protein CEE36_03945 [candidate division TA06 bacterium B3_TA06]|uniref:Secretion system C-terminal sorting domain-containing protein n=1 Tax=candidate division TA06 bacterium B3_TA06 TaxID=2012487 RepID=A0A532V8H9_UNCT6|nr:MAG: hypothetical protein CEE36_03945 [candidate division TA06 bacterium B3_TA06]
MFIFVFLTLFSAQPQWYWVDETERISLGLTFNQQQLEFVDVDLDGDEDMIRLGKEFGDSLEAFENILTSRGRQWKANQELLNGIVFEPPLQGVIHSLGVGDLNADGRDEIVISMEKGWSRLMFVFVNKGKPGEPLWELDTTLFDKEWVIRPDFADIDEDGDLDMMGYMWVEEDSPLPALWWNAGTPEKPSWELDSSYFGYWPALPALQWIDWDKDGVWDVLTGEWLAVDPRPDWVYFTVWHNKGSALSPEWDTIHLFLRNEIKELEILDWNQDGVEDIIYPGYDWDEGYHYIPGRLTSEGIAYDARPIVWGGILGHYPAAADLDADGIPELAVAEQEYQEDPFGPGYLFPYFRHHSSANEDGTLWQVDTHYRYWEWNVHIPISNGHLQYVDFSQDGLVDYVINIIKEDDESNYIGSHILHRNQGTKEEPEWVADSNALKELPPLFPSCFLDVDGDGDMDLIGELTADYEDSTVVGFINTGSDEEPIYEYHHDFITGLPSSGIIFLTPGDLTDNELDLPDLTVNTGYQGLVAYFNSGQDNPRWHKHEEVFKSLGVSGNPCLCDADEDGDLDLYLVQGGRLRYYRNESTGGIAESPDRPPSVTTSLIGHEVEVKLTVGTDSDKATLLLYNVAGQRIAEYSRRIEDGEASFRIVQQPGVYFYRLDVENQEFRGKIVIY